VLEIDPQDENVWHFKATALHNMERYEETIEVSEKLLRINPQNIAGWYMKAHTLRNLERYGEALDIYDKALDIDPQNEAILNEKKELETFIQDNE
jgi:tetratricopeptide (TPR) repeat protein